METPAARRALCQVDDKGLSKLQGLTPRLVKLEELFAANTMDS
jgi:hypothetical protein